MKIPGEKTTGSLLILLMLAALLAPDAFGGIDGSVSDSAFIIITLVNQEPDPVAPGEKLELRFRVENRGTAQANDVSLQLVPEFPFSADEREQTKEIGSLAGRQIGRDAVIARFLLTVDASAGSGVNPIRLRYKTATQGWISIETFNITVGQRDLPIAIASVEATPEIIIPGNKSTISISLANMGTAEALNVRVRLNFTDSLPFFPYGSTNERFIQRISPGKKAEAGFEVIASPSAKSAIYRIPMSLTYMDGSGNNYTVAGQSFSLTVGSRPQIKAAAVGTEIFRLNERKTVTLEIINDGLTDIKFLTARLAKPEQGQYDVLSPQSAYIGEIDSGDSETVSYDIFFSSPAPLVMELEYLDALNNRHMQLAEVPLRIFTGSEINRFGLEGKKGRGMLIISAIVLIGVLAYFRLRRKK